MVASGPPAEIRADPRVLDAYLGSDADEDGPPMTESALTVEGITAGYGGGDVLHDVSFAVPAGGITCIVGPNGAGKSTLLAVISGLLRPRSGQVLHRGEPLTGKSPREVLRAGVVQVPQNHSLFREHDGRRRTSTSAATCSAAGSQVASRRASRRGAVPRYRRLGEEEGGQPVRRPAAAGRVRPLPDARSRPWSSSTSRRWAWRRRSCASSSAPSRR